VQVTFEVKVATTVEVTEEVTFEVKSEAPVETSAEVRLQSDLPVHQK
jgi:hypothetical protein